jgi:hypothetical protein
MTLYEKIIKLYPNLTSEDFAPIIGTIQLQNDGQGDYIKFWANNNPKPTDEQLLTITFIQNAENLENTALLEIKTQN